MILLTGGTGAIGRTIVQEWTSRKDEFVIITRNKDNAKRVRNRNLIVEQGTISDPSFLSSIFKKYRFETVVHCAWDGVTGSLRNSPNQFNNFIAVKNLLELAGTNQIKNFIGLGSQAEYGVHNIRITEKLLPDPDSLYGVYKLSSGLLGRLLADQFGFRFAWLRLFAAYGPDDNKQFVIPYTISCLLENKAPALSSCEQWWDYLFLPDIPLIVKKIIDAPHHFNDIYNLSFGKATKLKDIIFLIRTILRSEIDPNFGAVSHKSDLFFLEGDNEKLTGAFNVTGLTDINKGLSLTVDWYKNQLAT